MEIDCQRGRAYLRIDVGTLSRIEVLRDRSQRVEYLHLMCCCQLHIRIFCLEVFRSVSLATRTYILGMHVHNICMWYGKFQQIAGEVSEMDDVLHAFLAEDGAQAAEVTEFVGIAGNSRQTKVAECR